MLLDISRLRRGAEEVNRQIDPEVFAVQTSDRHDEYTVKGVTTEIGRASCRERVLDHV